MLSTLQKQTKKQKLSHPKKDAFEIQRLKVQSRIFETDW